MGFFKFFNEVSEYCSVAQKEIEQWPQKIRKASEDSAHHYKRLEPARRFSVKMSINNNDIRRMIILVPIQYKESQKVFNSLAQFMDKLKEIALATESENFKTQEFILTFLTHLNQQDGVNVPDLLEIFKSDFPQEKLQAQGFRSSKLARELGLQDFEFIECVYDKEGIKLEEGFKALIPQANAGIESLNKVIKHINLSANNKIELLKSISFEQPSKKQNNNQNLVINSIPLEPKEKNASKKQRLSTTEMLFPLSEMYETSFQSMDLSKYIDYEFLIAEYSIIFIQIVGRNQVEVTIDKFYKCGTDNGKYILTEPQAIIFHELIVKPAMNNPEHFHPESENVQKFLKRFSHCKKVGNYNHGITPN